MAKPDMQMWHSVTLLFLSKFIQSTSQTFTRKDLINPNNIDLGTKFASMLGSEAEESEVRDYLKKSLKHLEREQLVYRSPAGEMHLTPAGIATMNTERARAMAKIAESFPSSAPQDQNTLNADKKSH